MDKSNILVTGLGQCGGKLADLMKEFNGRYTTTYLNSSLGDIKGLKHADVDSNVLIYSGTDGSGRDRGKAVNYFFTDKPRVATFIKRYIHYKHVIIFASLDGGTGSGTLIEYIKLIKQLTALTITVVGVLPRLKTELLNLENTTDCASELDEIKDLIDGLLLINNNKCSDMNYDEINLEAIQMIDRFFGMVGHHKDGSIDTDNLDRIILAKGYITLLKLPDEAKNIREAIKIAKENSIFALPETLSCRFAGINVMEGIYNKDDFSDKLKVKRTTYSTYNNKFNFIALGGCDMPTDDIEDIVDEIENKKENEPTDDVIKGFGIKVATSDTKDTSHKREEPIKKRNLFMDDDDIDSILSNPDDFRF